MAAHRSCPLSVADATPDYEVGSRQDRAFLGHPAGLWIPGLHRGVRALPITPCRLCWCSTWSNICSCRPCRVLVGCTVTQLLPGISAAARFGDLRDLHVAGLRNPHSRGDHRRQAARTEGTLIPGGLAMAIGHFPDGHPGQLPCSASLPGHWRRLFKAISPARSARFTAPTISAARWRSRSFTS